MNKLDKLKQNVESKLEVGIKYYSLDATTVLKLIQIIETMKEDMHTMRCVAVDEKAVNLYNACMKDVDTLINDIDVPNE